MPTDRINLTDEDDELGFGEEFYAEFEVDVDYTVEPYIPASWDGPAEGGSFEINEYDFTMKIVPVSNPDKNKLLECFFDYNALDEEKKKQINSWITKKLNSDSVKIRFNRSEDCWHA
jgi:hypothetical protein